MHHVLFLLILALSAGYMRLDIIRVLQPESEVTNFCLFPRFFFFYIRPRSFVIKQSSNNPWSPTNPPSSKFDIQSNFTIRNFRTRPFPRVSFHHPFHPLPLSIADDKTGLLDTFLFLLRQPPSPVNNLAFAAFQSILAPSDPPPIHGSIV